MLGRCTRSKGVFWLLMAGCLCQEQSPGGPPAQSQGPPAQAKPMSTSSARLRPFTLTYTSVGGPALGPGLSQRQSSLTVKSQDRSVFLEQHRSESDAPGEPVINDVQLLDGVMRLAPELSYLPQLHQPLQSLARLIEACGGVQRVTYR